MQLECCGVDNYKDFITKGIGIPGSCCGKNSSDTCYQMQYVYQTGCVSALKELFKYASAVLGGIALGIAAIEVNKSRASLWRD